MLAAYWALALVVPGLYMSNFGSIAIFSFGLITFAKYLPDTYDILAHGMRSKAEPGAHLAVVGTCLLAFGAIYIGAFNLLYQWLEKPDGWAGTAFSGFGRVCIAIGFCLMYLSPNFSKRGVNIPSAIWTMLAIAMALLAAYHVGVRVGEYSTR